VKLSLSEISPIAESTGFKAEMVEKVLQLINLLNTINAHPFLKGKWVLKGGTALNMFVFNLPRLSVDIDINYIGVLNREGMLADRPRPRRHSKWCFPEKDSPSREYRMNTRAESGG